MIRNRLKLSERLMMSAGMVTKGNRLADVGCDHAHTSIWLVKNRIVSKAIAMDVRTGPLEKANENIMLYGLSGVIETRLSDGLDALGEGEADSIVIAGMGGTLTVQILNNGLNKAAAARELILQPQSDIGMVRRFLREHGFSVVQEKMCIEDGKFYNAMRAVPEIMQHELKNAYGKGIDKSLAASDHEKDIPKKENSIILQEVYDEYGELLLKEKNPVLKELLFVLKRKNERNLDRIEASGNERGLAKKQELEREREILKAALGFF